MLFITPMLNVIMRLGLPGNSTLENRILAVDIASTLFYWDGAAAAAAGNRAAQDVSQANRSGVDDSRLKTVHQGSPDGNYKQVADGEHSR